MSARSGARPLYVLWEYPCPSEQFVRREIDGLAARGLDVQTLALAPGVPADADPTALRRPGSGACAGATLAFASLHPLRALRAMRDAVAVGVGEGPRGLDRALRCVPLALYFARRMWREPPSVVHAHFATTPATFALLLSRLLGRPMGLSVHAKDLYADRAHLALKAACSSYLLACSESTAHDLRERCDPADRGRVRTVYHGVDLDRWRRELPPAEPLRILAVGRLQVKKGFETLVDACAELHRGGETFQCEIVGAGPLEETLRGAIARRGLGGQVTLTGWLGPEELRRRYERASVLAVPSVVAPDGDRDNIPNVVLEALAMEVVVVASSLPGIAEVVVDQKTGLLVPPGDARALARALVRTRDEGLRARLATAGRARVAALFDLDRTAAQVQRAIEDALSPTTAR